MQVLPTGCSLYVHVKSISGIANDGDAASDIWVNVSAATQKHITRTVKKGSPLEWSDAYIFGEDVLVQGGRAISFEVNTKTRWTSSVQLAAGLLRLDQVELLQLGEVLTASVQLVAPEKANVVASLLLDVAVVQTESFLPSPIDTLVAEAGCSPQAAPTSSARAPSHAVPVASTLTPQVMVIPPGAAPRQLHCAAGSLYEEPCTVFICVTLHSASGLRHNYLDSPRHPRSVRLEKVPPSVASQRASAFVAKSTDNIATFFGLRRRKPDGTPDQPQPGTPPPTTPTHSTSPKVNPAIPPSASSSSIKTARTPSESPRRSEESKRATSPGSSPGSSLQVGAAVAKTIHMFKSKHSTQAAAEAAEPPPISAAPALPAALMAAAAAMSAVPHTASGSSTTSVLTVPAAEASSGSADATMLTAAASADADGGESPGVLVGGASESLDGTEGSSWDEGSRTSLGGGLGGFGGVGEVGLVKEEVKEEVREEEAKVEEILADHVMLALEANGFHSTDTPGGSHFYFKSSYEGQAWVSNMAQMEAGVAHWNQSFLIAAERPLPARPPLELDLLVSTDLKTRGRHTCKFRMDLPKLCGGLQPNVLGAPPTIHTIKGDHVSPDEPTPCYIRVSAEVVDSDPRAATIGIPLIHTPPTDPTPTPTPDPTEPPHTPTRQASLTSPLPPTLTHPDPPAPHTPPHTPSSTSLSSLSHNTSTALATHEATTAAAAPGTSPHIPHPAILQPAGAAPPPLATLQLMISSFEVLEKAADCFFVFQCGHFWGSSVPLSAHLQPRWDWEVHLPITDPSHLLSIGLFRAVDGAPASKLVSTTRSALFTDIARSIGRLRIRLTTLLPDKLCVVRLPLHADRQSTKGGATTAYVTLALRLQYQSTAACLLQYVQPPVFKPCILLMQKMDLPLHALVNATQKVSVRWLDECTPALPARIARRIADTGRQEFTLSRTQQNWRRLALQYHMLQPFFDWLDDICWWRHPLHSGALVSGVLLLAFHPSKMIALIMAFLVWRMVAYRYSRMAPGRWGTPPHMGEELQSKQEEREAVSAPLEAYAALKQNYDSLVDFSMKVQNVLDTLACLVERIDYLLHWEDPLATAMFCALLSAGALLTWLLGMRALVACGMLWVLRPPQLRDPYPPPPVNFFTRLPKRSDIML